MNIKRMQFEVSGAGVASGISCIVSRETVVVMTMADGREYHFTAKDANKLSVLLREVCDLAFDHQPSPVNDLLDNNVVVGQHGAIDNQNPEDLQEALEQCEFTPVDRAENGEPVVRAEYMRDNKDIKALVEYYIDEECPYYSDSMWLGHHVYRHIADLINDNQKIKAIKWFRDHVFESFGKKLSWRNCKYVADKIARQEFVF